MIKRFKVSLLIISVGIVMTVIGCINGGFKPIYIGNNLKPYLYTTQSVHQSFKKIHNINISQLDCTNVEIVSGEQFKIDSNEIENTEISMDDKTLNIKQPNKLFDINFNQERTDHQLTITIPKKEKLNNVNILLSGISSYFNKMMIDDQEIEHLNINHNSSLTLLNSTIHQGDISSNTISSNHSKLNNMNLNSEELTINNSQLCDNQIYMDSELQNQINHSTIKNNIMNVSEYGTLIMNDCKLSKNQIEGRKIIKKQCKDLKE